MTTGRASVERRGTGTGAMGRVDGTLISTQVAPVADRIFEVYEDEFREFQREHEARAQAGAQARDAMRTRTRTASTWRRSRRPPTRRSRQRQMMLRSRPSGAPSDDADEQRAAAAAAIDLLAGRGNLGAGIEHTIGAYTASTPSRKPLTSRTSRTCRRSGNGSWPRPLDSGKWSETTRQCWLGSGPPGPSMLRQTTTRSPSFAT